MRPSPGRRLVIDLSLSLLLAMVAGAGCASAPPTSGASSRSATSGSAAPTGPVAGPTSSAQRASESGGPCGSAGTAPASYQHVIWVWMENHTWPQVLGDPAAAPYAASLARQCATATRYASVGSPSLPNYIGATSGGTQGMADDGPPVSHPLTVDNLFRQVRNAGGTERSYAEDMASSCQLGSSGGYAVKHNPAAYYLGAGDRAACQADDVAFTSFRTDLRGGRLATFSFVIPNLCHSTHDCAVASGDAWLAGLLPQVLASPPYRSGTTAVFVIWDEESPMPNLVISPSVVPGTVVAAASDHYALLRTTEEMLGLADHLGAAAAAPSLRRPFHL